MSYPEGLCHERKMSRVLFLTDVPPAPTGGGAEVAAYGLSSALRHAGFEVICVSPSALSVEQAVQREFPVHFLSNGNAQLEFGQTLLKGWLDRYQPMLAWVFGARCWPLFAPFRSRFPHVLYWMDSGWEMEKLRRRWRRVRKGLRGVGDGLRDMFLVWALQRKERLALRQCSERGVAASYVASEVPEIIRRAGAALRECTLCYPDWQLVERRSDSLKPQALLLGHLEGTHTRYGLRFFFDEVMPLWQSPEGPRSAVRVVGNGRLPETFSLPPENNRLQWIGFVSDLTDEWSRATALLVPVPLRQGIRSRIVEAWSRGVPVISHPNAAVGLPMMKDGENYLAAEDGPEWIEAMRKVENDEALCRRLTATGRAVFEAEFSAEAGATRVGNLARLAIDQFFEIPKV